MVPLPRFVSSVASAASCDTPNSQGCYAADGTWRLIAAVGCEVDDDLDAATQARALEDVEGADEDVGHGVLAEREQVGEGERRLSGTEFA